ncbi:MAG: hypothetical protein QF524_06490, partial [Planctomycetota bacterium]|nr:hypothetical protein [Planctomycetota bacterium]
MRLLFALGTLLALLVGITTWKVMDPPAAVEARGVNPNTGVVLLGLKEKPNSSVRILKQPKNMGESEHIPAPPPVGPGNVSPRPAPAAPPSPPAPP